MKKHFYNLFIPHHGNNHKPKLLHHWSLSKLVLLILLCQLVLSVITQTKPGVLGFASNINVDQIVALTNERRQAQGLEPLRFNSTLSDSARQKAAHMFANNYWAHNGPDGTSPWYFFKNVGYNYLYAGENLARDFGDSSSVLQAWMDSPTHRDNIMSGRYNEIGIAVVNGILNGQETTLVVQHFGKQSSVQAAIPDQAVAEVASGKSEGKKQLVNTETVQKPVVAVSEPVEDVTADIVEKKQQTVGGSSIEQLFPDTQLSQARSTKSSFISPFDITKSINIALTTVIVTALALDGFLIWHRKTVRRSGKSFIHLSLLLLVMLIIILTNSGKIL